MNRFFRGLLAAAGYSDPPHAPDQSEPVEAPLLAFGADLWAVPPGPVLGRVRRDVERPAVQPAAVQPDGLVDEQPIDVRRLAIPASGGPRDPLGQEPFAEQFMPVVRHWGVATGSDRGITVIQVAVPEAAGPRTTSSLGWEVPFVRMRYTADGREHHTDVLLSDKVTDRYGKPFRRGTVVVHSDGEVSTGFRGDEVVAQREGELRAEAGERSPADVEVKEVYFWSTTRDTFVEFRPEDGPTLFVGGEDISLGGLDLAPNLTTERPVIRDL